jgi:uncharacterized membrane protein
MADSALEEQAAWGFPARKAPRWPATLAVITALVLYITLPNKLVIGPTKIVLPALEAALIVPLTIMWPHRSSDESRLQRWTALLLIALVNAANVGSLALLVQSLLYGHVHAGRNEGLVLIYSAASIWLTLVIVFALWYWELDRGGPGARCEARHREPDFLFPQMANPEAAPKRWAPQFLDYLYVSLTNATAFSPTDTLPLTPWSKSLMGAQSVVSLVTIALVAARAVNILNS